MPAYPNKQAFKERPIQFLDEKKEELAFVVANQFLTPHDPKLRYETLLAEALMLSKRDDFIEKRNSYRKWQEDVIENDMTPKQAVVEMEKSLEQHHAIVKKSKVSLISKVSFLIVEVALSLGWSSSERTAGYHVCDGFHCKMLAV